MYKRQPVEVRDAVAATSTQILQGITRAALQTSSFMSADVYKRQAIYDLLARLDLDAWSYELRHRAGNDASQQRKNEALKRLQVVESFRASRGRNKPEWMIVRIVPVRCV